VSLSRKNFTNTVHQSTLKKTAQRRFSTGWVR